MSDAICLFLSLGRWPVYGETGRAGLRFDGVIPRRWNKQRNCRDSFDEQPNLKDGAEVPTLDHYDSRRRALNHAMARAARNGLIFPLGRALVDKGLYLPESWTSDPGRCAGAGVPEDRRSYRSKTGLALELLERALQLGHLRAKWVAGDDAFGMSPSFRDGLAALGTHYVLDVPGGSTVWPLEPAWTSAEYQGFGRPRKPKLRDGQRRTMEQCSDELPGDAWREITVAEGSQGPRSYQFSAQRVRATRRRKPGEIHWGIYRRNLDGSEPRYYLSNAPEDTPLETLAYVGGSRWRIETEFETEKSDVGLDECETQTWPGWRHHVALCLLAGAFLLSLQQDWGGRCPGSPGPKACPRVNGGLPGGAGNAAPGTVRAE